MYDTVFHAHETGPSQHSNFAVVFTYWQRDLEQVSEASDASYSFLV